MLWIAGRHRWCLWVFKLKRSFALWSIRGAKKHIYVDVRSPISTTVIYVEIQALCGAIPILEEIEVPWKCLLITKKTFHLCSIFTPQHKMVGKFVAKNNNSSHAICEQIVDINAWIRKRIIFLVFWSNNLKKKILANELKRMINALNKTFSL